MTFPPDAQAHAEFQALFDPRGIALIGASTDPARLGYGMARNLLHSGYRGAVYLVNLHGGSLFGQPIYQSILQVPDPLDLAVLLIPATRIPEALHQCGARGVRAVVVASSGFREIGAAGAVLEAEITSIARQYQMRLLGPNCIGLIDTGLPLNVTFLPPPGPPTGELAFLSHSGAICAALIDWARSQGFGFSRLISLGNQADLNETDLLAPVAADPATRVLTLYLESLPDGPRFVQHRSPGKNRWLPSRSGDSPAGSALPPRTPVHWQGRTAPTRLPSAGQEWCEPILPKSCSIGRMHFPGAHYPRGAPWRC
jgi:acyl-CoA synthetase (NDP forming)